MIYTTLASDDAVVRTTANLSVRGYETIVVQTGKEALETIQGMIPPGSSVMNGSSTTLSQIGFTQYLKEGLHGWDNLHEGILLEQDKAKQSVLRKQAVLSTYYLGSVHALTENGEFVIASNTGSQLPHVVNTSQHLVFVVSTKKIVTNLAQAMERLEQHVVPLEDKRMHNLYGVGTAVNKLLIVKGENPMMGRKITFILVKEDLGF